MRICLIGNSGIKSNDKGGQTTKLRLYKKKIEDEGFELCFVDLENFLHRPFSVFRRIKKGIKWCDRVVLISGERACKLLIPYINKLKAKYNKIFILPVVGIGVLHYSIDKLSFYDKSEFLFRHNFDKIKPSKKILNELKNIDYILLETIPLKETYKLFYNLKNRGNCFQLDNFREYNSDPKYCYNAEKFDIIFLSRVSEIKGIFDLIYVVEKDFNEHNISLDIFGKMELSNREKDIFYKKLNEKIKYIDAINSNNVIDTISYYDLFIFPTRYLGEGTPGVISESLLAGTPVLTSNFPAAKYLLKDGFDSIFYEMFNIEELKNKLEWCLNNKDKIRDMRKNCLESSKRFTYEYNRKDFLKYVCGVEEK